MADSGFLFFIILFLYFTLGLRKEGGETGQKSAAMASLTMQA